ncbi:CoA transferase [Methylobacterium sp. J-070]|uniref:CoA transferase n=1 Tax=Methylobacterium sp. J-070 TaxID=2836650 RepID=UPI001FBB55EA|nr:CoA transferase [Methylobacterium sp. J-070]MCJ2052902.1 CoA transferase [Methylobacterium sp. J-070]
MTDRHDAFAELMALRGRGMPASGEVAIEGCDPFFRTPFRVGETAAACLAAIGVAASDIWEARTGRRQRVGISVRQAAATLRTVDYTSARDADGTYRPVPIPDAMAHMLTVTQPWRTADDRYLLPHLNLPHLAARVLGVLGCESTPDAVARAVARWRADDLEEAIAEARACGGTVRTREAWLAHPQGAYLAGRPAVEIEPVGDAPARPLPPAVRPLSGMRVLDLTRILAGPIAGRCLAEHGADVLMVTAPDLPQTPEHVRDTSHGKRSCFLDFRDPRQRDRFRALVSEADVVIDGYRPGVMARFDLDADSLTALRPGLVHVAVTCFGSGGPFADRAGWEQVAQAVTGICDANGLLTGAGRPKLVFAPTCDYTTGYLAAYGTMLALGQRLLVGGGYRVHASLCRSAMLIQAQGLVDGFESAPERLSEADLTDLWIESDSAYGTLRTLGPVLRLSETSGRWSLPTPKLGMHAAEWVVKGRDAARAAGNIDRQP